MGREIFIGNQKLDVAGLKSEGKEVKLDNESFYKITNINSIRPFFISIASSDDHWLFVSSNGGISAGRGNSNNALFPYYTDDKITENFENTGPKTIFHVEKGSKVLLWEPFSNNYLGTYKIQRNLYKNLTGNKVIFEEINNDLGLAFSYQWTTSKAFGFIRTAKLVNIKNKATKINTLDGIQNILPWGVDEGMQVNSSNLVDAYKRSELEPKGKIGIFALSAVIVDKAEPSEALKSNVVWSPDFQSAPRLLSNLQINNFRYGSVVKTEQDIKGERGSYFINFKANLKPKQIKEWQIIADTGLDHSGVAKLEKSLRRSKNLKADISKDIDAGQSELVKLISSSDGIQKTQDRNRNIRHFSNTLFNIMRGGIFDNNYQVNKADFLKYLKKANKQVFKKYSAVIETLPNNFHFSKLFNFCTERSRDFFRLITEYMPIKFSRRHGDPSRPWNKFDIRMRDKNTGEKVLDYQGNWRDIFQNWEALATSYPEFIFSMIFRFLNASTADGYNPYRLTKDGFDWETLEADNPWSYIGYWGDHQIIYLLKFLEFSEKYFPDELQKYFNKNIFVYANVPYKIKGFSNILKDPKNTIDFDYQEEEKILNLKSKIGSDGALLHSSKNKIIYASLIEKLLVPLLAKVSNFVPDAGIWMNTQRPEWNDANNALVGNGVSMVTLCYMRRFTSHFKDMVSKSNDELFIVSQEAAVLFSSLAKILKDTETRTSKRITNIKRLEIAKKLGKRAQDYRSSIYQNSFSGEKQAISKSNLVGFLESLNLHLDRTIKINKRDDGMYHAYNLISHEKNGLAVSHLPLMLEGQVAVLSSGYLEANESLSVLDNLKGSELFRKDQYSYLLYPAKQLPGFLEKNIVPKKLFKTSMLLQMLVKDNNPSIVTKDINSHVHFNGTFNNVDSLNTALDELPNQYKKLVQAERQKIENIFEQVFNHKAFTGRSGTFYGYEGLGSIYWHMVSKLLLAVQEVTLSEIKQGGDKRNIGRLFDHYFEINEGIGANKSPALYGAIPTDPYSHTPAGKGAQQPGMTGQVKEDILARNGEMGLDVINGAISFNPRMLRKSEFLEKQSTFSFYDIKGQLQIVNLRKNSLAFTVCQVPVIYELAKNEGIEIFFRNKTVEKFANINLSQKISRKIFKRDGSVEKVVVKIKK